MVDMDKKEQILHYHRIDGLSQREIARRVAEELFLFFIGMSNWV
jgi:hypothetical protein